MDRAAHVPPQPAPSRSRRRRALLGSYADGVRFVFPGRSSWAGDYHGKQEIEPFLRRFVHAGLHLEPHEILVTGLPWRTRFCLRYTNWFAAPNGEVSYANRGTIFGTIAWGKLTCYEVYEDTQKVAEFDEYLAQLERTAVHASSSH